MTGWDLSCCLLHVCISRGVPESEVVRKEELKTKDESREAGEREPAAEEGGLKKKKKKRDAESKACVCVCAGGGGGGGGEVPSDWLSQQSKGLVRVCCLGCFFFYMLLVVVVLFSQRSAGLRARPAEEILK